MVRTLTTALTLLCCASGAAAQTTSGADWSRAGGGLFAGMELEQAEAPLPPGTSVNLLADSASGQDDVQLLLPEQPYAAAVSQAAVRHGLDPKLLHALVVVESGYRPRAASHAGAAGLTQLMPATARELGVADRTDPIENLRGGAAYLARQVVRFGDLRLALAAYNAGPGRVARSGRIPAIPETQAYVTAVVDCYLALSAGRGVRSARECPTDRSVR